jgi:hypothetical protein
MQTFCSFGYSSLLVSFVSLMSIVQNSSFSYLAVRSALTISLPKQSPVYEVYPELLHQQML